MFTVQAGEQGGRGDPEERGCGRDGAAAAQPTAFLHQQRQDRGRAVQLHQHQHQAQHRHRQQQQQQDSQQS